MAASRGPSLNAQNAPSVPEDGMPSSMRGEDVLMTAPATPRTRTMAQVPGGAQMIENAAAGMERSMPRVSVVR